MIALNNIFFAYPHGPSVLEDISLNVNEGEILGILGPNGSGKTTLMHLMAGLLEPVAGVIELSGGATGRSPLQSLSREQIAKHIALVPQKESIHLPFSVWDIVMMGRQPYQNLFGFESAADRTIAEESLRLTESYALKERSIQELSGGERRRVLIARALAQKTRVLILDEPTAHLDLHFQKEICDLLVKLKSDNRCIVVSLHDINLAALYCDRIVLLSDRKVYSQGSVDSVITQENLQAVYQVALHVDKDAQSGIPYCRPLKA
jgi:iron complex transport system ATP-binding protein